MSLIFKWFYNPAFWFVYKLFLNEKLANLYKNAETFPNAYQFHNKWMKLKLKIECWEPDNTHGVPCRLKMKIIVTLFSSVKCFFAQIWKISVFPPTLSTMSFIDVINFRVSHFLSKKINLFQLSSILQLWRRNEKAYFMIFGIFEPQSWLCAHKG